MNPITSGPKFDEIPFIGFRDMLFTRFWVIACCDFGLLPLDPKANQHIYEALSTPATPQPSRHRRLTLGHFSKS